jgi:hypothetical protein
LSLRGHTWDILWEESKLTSGTINSSQNMLFYMAKSEANLLPMTHALSPYC